MGLLRLFLALIVVFAHIAGLNHIARPLLPIGPVEAVQIFFMISGFYMALILNEKYRGPGSYPLFLSNRLLRLYPIYLVVLVLSAAAWLFSARTGGDAGPLGVGHFLHWRAAAVVSLANLAVVGQDLLMFSGIRDGHLRFTRAFATSNPPTWLFLLIPQAWSIALEFDFYLIAPALVRRSPRFLASVILCALGLRALIYFVFKLAYDPWNYRFFPTELALFLTGALAYHGYRSASAAKARSFAPLAAVGCFAIFYFLPPVGVMQIVSLKQWLLYGAVALLLPGLFRFSKNNRWDRYIGELSYPIYCCHWLVLTFLPRLLCARSITLGVAVLCVVATLVFSVLLVELVAAPVEKLRQRRAARFTHQPVAAEHDAALIQAAVAESPPPL